MARGAASRPRVSRAEGESVVIEVQELRKAYGDLLAVDGISFEEQIAFEGFIIGLR